MNKLGTQALKWNLCINWEYVDHMNWQNIVGGPWLVYIYSMEKHWELRDKAQYSMYGQSFGPFEPKYKKSPPYTILQRKITYTGKNIY
jgi:hypothetical protein